MTVGFTLRSALLGSCIALAATSVSAKELRGWNIHVEDYPVSIAMDFFAESISEATDGDSFALAYWISVNSALARSGLPCRKPTLFRCHSSFLRSHRCTN